MFCSLKGIEIVFRIAIALLDIHQDELMLLSMEDMLKVRRKTNHCVSCMSFLIHTFCIDIFLRRFSCKVEVQNTRRTEKRKKEGERERERGINDTIAGVMIVMAVRSRIYIFCSV